MNYEFSMPDNESASDAEAEVARTDLTEAANFKEEVVAHTSADNVSVGQAANEFESTGSHAHPESHVADLDSSVHSEDDEVEAEAPVAPAPSKRRGKPISEEEIVDLNAATPENRHWYILKVQSNREDSIRRNLIRKIRIADKEAFFGDIVVPTEKVTEVRNGKKRVLRRKLYPGYVMINMELNEETLFLIRDTAGIGEFTGSGGKPTPMAPHEVERILAKQEDRSDTAPRLQIAFKEGDRVKINEGTFHDIEGDVESIDQSNGRVTVMINIFGRSTPVELEYWQVETI